MKSNWTRAEVTTADIPGLLSLLTNSGIELRDVRNTDSLHIRFLIKGSQLQALHAIANKRGVGVRVPGRGQKGSRLRMLHKRPVLTLGLIALAALTLFLPTRVLFVRVEGNHLLSQREILDSAAECGIRMGVSSSSIRSEQVKNRLLQEMPLLQWVGVNTRGCVAVISVRERSTEEAMPHEPMISSMVAARDGIIASCTATRGSLLCSPGQAVSAGDVLISGYTNCGIVLRAGSAAGEIYARTLHKVTVAAPLDWEETDGNGITEKKITLIIGKKRINFYKDSGILGTTCDKMYTQYVLTLPGGFQLPLTLVVEHSKYFEEETVTTQIRDVSSLAMDTAKEYLLDQMIGGQILSSNCRQEDADGLLLLRGEYQCMEMIGRIRSEEIIQKHGENN